MTIHIDAKKEDVAKIVLMPGDPLRAKFIADKFLKKVKIVSKVRGNIIYTGFYHNKKISVMASGMGNPSMGIYSYELFKIYEVDVIIRLGSCGVYDSDMKLHDLVLVKASYSNSNYAKEQNGSEEKLLKADQELLNKIEIVLKNLNLKYYLTDVYCTDTFYRQSVYNKEQVVVEMESFALFHNAKILNKKAACLLTVSDSVKSKEKLSPIEREKSFVKMIEVALKTTGDL